MQLTVLKF